MKRTKLFLVIALALSAAVTMKAQKFYLPDDISFTGKVHYWAERTALYETTDPEMWVLCHRNSAPVFMFMKKFVPDEDYMPGGFITIGLSGVQVFWIYYTKNRSVGTFMPNGQYGSIEYDNLVRKTAAKDVTYHPTGHVLELNKIGLNIREGEGSSLWKGHSFYSYFPKPDDEARDLRGWYKPSYDPRTGIASADRGYAP